MAIRVFNPPSVHDTSALAYSQAAEIGGLIFVAGQVALDREGRLVGENDIRAQTEQTFRNLRAVLEAAGSGLENVGKVTVFITKLEYRPIVHEIRTRVFSEVGTLPASTLAVVASLARPEWLVEIEAVASAG